MPISFLLSLSTFVACEHNSRPGVLNFAATPAPSPAAMQSMELITANIPIALPELRLPEPRYVEPTWHVATSGQDFLGPYSVRFSVGGDLVSAGGDYVSYVHRTIDGAPLGIPTDHSAAVMDTAWEVTASTRYPDMLEVKAVQADVVLSWFPLPGSPLVSAPWLRATYPAISPDGGRAAVLMCWDQVGEGETTSTLTVWDLATETEALSLDLGVGCKDGSLGSRQYLQFNHDGDWMVIVLPGTYTLLTVDVLTGHTSVLDIEAISDGEVVEHPGYADPVLALALTPDGKQLAISTRHGQAHRIAMPSLELLETLSVGVFRVHQHSYMPSLQSPLAWSPDSRQLAMTNEDGEPTILDVTNNTVPFILRRPRLTGDDYGLSLPGSPGYLLAMAFRPDGNGLVTLGEAGLSGWLGHDVAPVDEAPTASVAASTASKIVKGTEFPVNVYAKGFSDLAVRTLLVDGTMRPGQSAFGGPLVFGAWQTGTYTIQVQVDDGVRTAVSPPLSVTVTESVTLQ